MHSNAFISLHNQWKLMLSYDLNDVYSEAFVIVLQARTANNIVSMSESFAWVCTLYYYIVPAILLT